MLSAVELLEKALSKNELHKLLMGSDEYYYPDRFAETPTDLATVFIQAFNVFVKRSDNNKEALRLHLKNALIKLLDTPEGTWWCLSIVYSYKFGYKANALLFKIDLNEILPMILARISKYEQQLKENKEWVGYRFNDGLWHDVAFMSNKLSHTLTEMS